MNFATDLIEQHPVALIGLAGALVGAAATVVGQIGAAIVTAKLQDFRDKARKKLLLRLLKDRPAGTKWRAMSTLCRCIGASEDETARLLVSIGARGSLGDKNVWGLISVVGMPKYDDPEQDN